MWLWSSCDRLHSSVRRWRVRPSARRRVQGGSTALRHPRDARQWDCWSRQRRPRGVDAGNAWSCDGGVTVVFKSARKQVVERSLRQKDRGPALRDGEIRRSRVMVDRVIEAPADGVLRVPWSCHVVERPACPRQLRGFQSFDGTWYLYLHRGR